MFAIIKNNIYLWFWKRKGQHPYKHIKVVRKVENLQNMVYDLIWVIILTDKDNKVLLKSDIHERTNRQNMIRITRRVERESLPKEIKRLMKKHPDTNPK
ncbi:MAG: hypothetical protein ACI3X7_00790 [Bacteroidaceae bacterium]